MISGRCWSSAADEEWYSPKRPSNTVAVNSSGLNAKVSTFFLVLGFVDLLWQVSTRCFHSVSTIVPVGEGVTVALDDQGREGILQIKGAIDFLQAPSPL